MKNPRNPYRKHDPVTWRHLYAFLDKEGSQDDFSSTVRFAEEHRISSTAILAAITVRCNANNDEELFALLHDDEHFPTAEFRSRIPL